MVLYKSNMLGRIDHFKAKKQPQTQRALALNQPICRQANQQQQPYIVETGARRITAERKSM